MTRGGAMSEPVVPIKVLRGAHTQDGTSLAKLSQDRAVMLVFLRHFG